jgi:hypothetical protein
MEGPIPSEALRLTSRPILVVTAFSAKLTHQSDYNFLRLAEEDFAHSTGPPIAFGAEYRADYLPDPKMFSALVVEDYRHRDIEAAFKQIQRFSREKPVVLLESPDPLFQSLVQRSSTLGRVAIVRRTPSNSDRWIGTTRFGSYRGDSVRQTWRRVRATLEPMLPVANPDLIPSCELDWGPGGQNVQCNLPANSGPVPVAINTNFHPEWRTLDGQPPIMLGPSLIYADVLGETRLRFQRSGLDLAAAIASVLTLVVVLAGMLRGLRRRGVT